MSKKNKNYIDITDSKLELESSDFFVTVMNDYQFRVSMPDLKPPYYDWYHTSGAVVVNREDRSPARLPEDAYTAVELINLINKTENALNFI